MKYALHFLKYYYQFLTLFDKLSYYNQLNAQCQCVILQLKHYISNMFLSFLDHHQGEHTSINKYEGDFMFHTYCCMASLMMIYERSKHVGDVMF